MGVEVNTCTSGVWNCSLCAAGMGILSAAGVALSTGLALASRSTAAAQAACCETLCHREVWSCYRVEDAIGYDGMTLTGDPVACAALQMDPTCTDMIDYDHYGRYCVVIVAGVVAGVACLSGTFASISACCIRAENIEIAERKAARRAREMENVAPSAPARSHRSKKRRPKRKPIPPPPSVKPSEEVPEWIQRVIVDTHGEAVTCSITGKLLHNAVIDPHGHTFTENAILSKLGASQLCPVNGKPLKKEQLAPNLAVRSLIEREASQLKELGEGSADEGNDGSSAQSREETA